MVRRIVFADGTSWAARLRLPPLQSFRDRELLDTVDILKVEVASMRFLKARTTLPVPEVYFYSVDLANPVGAPYILMEYIDGTVAAELREIKDCAVGLFGTPDQDRMFRQQMANIQATLSSFTFNKIGSLHQDEQTSAFFIGPDIETGKGPWDSSMDYYSDLADHALWGYIRNEEPGRSMSWSSTLPLIFKYLISRFGRSDLVNGPFRPVNRDFGAHNLLTNDRFEIVGIIDFDGIMAAPIEVVAQYPVLTRLDREPPGHVETKPAAIDCIKRTEPKLEEYKDLVRAAEARIGKSDSPETSVADLMQSEAASVFQGLLRYLGHQERTNDEWMEAYMRLIHKTVKPDIA